MRSICQLVICRVEHILSVIDEYAIAEAMALFPLTLCLNAIRLEIMTRETRSASLRISLLIVWILYDSRKQNIDQYLGKANEKAILIFRSQWAERFLDIVFVTMTALEANTRLSIERLGTQSVLSEGRRCEPASEGVEAEIYCRVGIEDRHDFQMPSISSCG
jgi:hypothetical protein